MNVNNYDSSQSIMFGKFIKIKSTTSKIDKFRDSLRISTDEFLTMKKDKKNSKSVLYLISGSDLKKFMKLSKKTYFRELRMNIEKYMKKPKIMSIKKAEKKYIK